MIQRCISLILIVVLGGPFAANADTQVPSSKSEITLSFAPLVKKSAPAVVNIYAQRVIEARISPCLLYTSPSPRDRTRSRMPSSA